VFRERLRLLAHEFGLQLKVVLRLSHIQRPVRKIHRVRERVRCQGHGSVPDLRRLLIETVGGFTGGGKKSFKDCPGLIEALLHELTHSGLVKKIETTERTAQVRRSACGFAERIAVAHGLMQRDVRRPVAALELPARAVGAWIVAGGIRRCALLRLPPARSPVPAGRTAALRWLPRGGASAHYVIGFLLHAPRLQHDAFLDLVIGWRGGCPR
jgi:hypothetical protein